VAGGNGGPGGLIGGANAAGANAGTTWSGASQVPGIGGFLPDVFSGIGGLLGGNAWRRASPACGDREADRSAHITPDLGSTSSPY